MVLHDWHQRLGANFHTLDGEEAVLNYGDWRREYDALTASAVLIDLSFRGRVCVLGADRARFLHGQVTNDVNRLAPGQGCYAALISAKGRMQSDLNIFRLEEELLLDFEPGLTSKVMERLEKYIIADDVQIVDVVKDYGLLSVQGPASRETLFRAGFTDPLPPARLSSVKVTNPEWGEIYLANNPRQGSEGFDLFVPSGSLGAVATSLVSPKAGAVACGWQAFEVARIEAGIPRFGVDMDETNIPLEAGLEKLAISFNKGCYIGQEIISRIKTYGQVSKSLRHFRFVSEPGALPSRGTPLFYEAKESGYLTSAAFSPRLAATVALGYLRREADQTETAFSVGAPSTPNQVRVMRSAAGSLPV